MTSLHNVAKVTLEVREETREVEVVVAEVIFFIFCCKFHSIWWCGVFRWL